MILCLKNITNNFWEENIQKAVKFIIFQVFLTALKLKMKTLWLQFHKQNNLMLEKSY